MRTRSGSSKLTKESDFSRSTRHLREMGRAEEAEEVERQANQLREAGF